MFKIVNLRKKRLWWLIIFAPLSLLYVYQVPWFQFNNYWDAAVYSCYAFGYIGVLGWVLGAQLGRQVFWVIFFFLDITLHIIDVYYATFFQLSMGTKFHDMFYGLFISSIIDFVYFAFIYLYAFESKNIWHHGINQEDL